MRSTRSGGVGQTGRWARRGIVGLAIGALVLLGGTVGCAPSSGPRATITPTELAQRIEAGTAPLILDVRSKREYDAGHIPGAINIPYDQLAGRLDELPVGRDDEIVVHCLGGPRAHVAEDVLAKAGYTNVRDLEGHWRAWIRAKLPVE